MPALVPGLGALTSARESELLTCHLGYLDHTVPLDKASLLRYFCNDDASADVLALVAASLSGRRDTYYASCDVAYGAKLGRLSDSDETTFTSTLSALVSLKPTHISLL